MPISMAMKITFLFLLFSLFFNSCSHIYDRSPASTRLSYCKDKIYEFLINRKVQYKALQVPNNTKTYKMLGQFKGEELSSSNRPIRYLNEEERKPYEVFLNDQGLVVDSQGAPLTSPIKGNRPIEAIYVISPKGKFYVSYLTPDDLFQHSSFLSGGHVIGAGQITFHKGTIQTLSNESGHYYPPIESLDTIITILENRGVKIMNVLVAGDD